MIKSVTVMLGESNFRARHVRDSLRVKILDGCSFLVIVLLVLLQLCGFLVYVDLCGHCHCNDVYTLE